MFELASSNSSFAPIVAVEQRRSFTQKRSFTKIARAHLTRAQLPDSSPLSEARSISVCRNVGSTPEHKLRYEKQYRGG